MAANAWARRHKLDRRQHLIQTALTATLLTLAITSRVGMVAWPFLNDSGLFAVLGRTVATGGVMYRDFYETKLPGAGLLAAGFWQAFGSCWAGYVLCQLVMTLLAAGALARAAARHVERSAALPTFLFAVVFLNFAYIVFTGFQLETIQVFFEALAAAASLEALSPKRDVRRVSIKLSQTRLSPRRRGDAEKSIQIVLAGFHQLRIHLKYEMSSLRLRVSAVKDLAAFTAGLAAGCAAMAKPGGMGVAVVLVVCLLGRRPLRILSVVAGAAIPTLATLYYTVQSGAYPYLGGAIHDIARYAVGTPMHWDTAVKIVLALAVFGWPFIATLSLPSRGTGGTPVLLFASLWFAVDLIAVLAQRRMYPYHFLPLACPAALLYGLLPRPRPLRVAIGLLPIALLSLTWEGSSPLHLSRGFKHTAVADYITAHTTATDTVFADQAGRLLIETNRNPGSRLGTYFYFVNDDDAPEDYCRVMLDDFESRRPKYLVLAEGWDQPVPGLATCDILSQCPARRANFISAWARLRDYVTRKYGLAIRIDSQLIYLRK